MSVNFYCSQFIVIHFVLVHTERFGFPVTFSLLLGQFSSYQFSQTCITGGMNMQLYDRDYLVPRTAMGLCRGHRLGGVLQGAAAYVCMCIH